MAHGCASPRIAFYSHDSVGLGHVRRNVTLAHAFADLAPAPHMLLVSGTSEAGMLRLPPRTDLVTLPALHKDRSGSYAARRLGVHLDHLVAVRGATLAAALHAFDPDLLVVDRHARGFRGELDGALPVLRARGTRIVLGLRDVLDEPAAVLDEWRRAATDDALARWFDEVWAFGDARVTRPLAALGGIRPVPVRSTGFLVQQPATAALHDGAEVQMLARLLPPGAPWVLGMVGGGADGLEVAQALVRAPLPAGMHAVVVTGPQMPDADRAALARAIGERQEVHLVRAVADPWPLLVRASAVIAMAGYNTACETLALDVPVLFMPRTTPRREQWLRATAFERHGLCQVLEPERGTPAALGAWLEHAMRHPRVDRTGVDRDGLAGAAALAEGLLARGRHPVLPARVAGDRPRPAPGRRPGRPAEVPA